VDLYLHSPVSFLKVKLRDFVLVFIRGNEWATSLKFQGQFAEELHYTSPETCRLYITKVSNPAV